MTVDARISTALPSHPKTKKLIRRLGPQAGWSLVCLFLWAAANRSDGDLSGMTDEDIELAAEWAGDESAFVDALVSVRFLDGEHEARSIHDWAEHNPWAAGAESRSLKAKWNAAKRHHGEAEADRLVPEYRANRTASSNASSTKNSNATSTEVLPSGNAPSPSPSPSPYLKESPNGDSSPAEPDDPPGMPPCPVKRIIAAYHEALPMLPTVRAFPATAERMLRVRWREDSERQTLEWWADFFAYVGTCPFLIGQKNDFTADLIWLVKPNNFAKVINGNYEAKEAA